MQSVTDTLQSSLRLNIFLPYDPEIVLLGSYPNELKTYIHKNCPWILIAALLAKTWKQPRFPFSRWAVYSDSAMLFGAKKSELSRHGGTFSVHYPLKEVNLKRPRTVWVHLCDILEKVKLETVKGISGCQEWWEGGVNQGSTEYFWGQLKLLCLIGPWWGHVVVHLSRPRECAIPRVNLV